MYMNWAHELKVFVCFVLIGISNEKFLPFNAKTDERESSHTLASRAEKHNRFSTETLVLFTLPALYRQNGFSYVTIKCCSSNYHFDGALVGV